MGLGSRRKGRPLCCTLHSPAAALALTLTYTPCRLRVTRRETLAILRQALVPQVPLHPAASRLSHAARLPAHSYKQPGRSRIALHHAGEEATAAGWMLCMRAAHAGVHAAAAHGQRGLVATHRAPRMLRARAGTVDADPRC